MLRYQVEKWKKGNSRRCFVRHRTLRCLLFLPADSSRRRWPPHSLPRPRTRRQETRTRTVRPPRPQKNPFWFEETGKKKRPSWFRETGPPHRRVSPGRPGPGIPRPGPAFVSVRQSGCRVSRLPVETDRTRGEIHY